MALLEPGGAAVVAASAAWQQPPTMRDTLQCRCTGRGAALARRRRRCGGGRCLAAADVVVLTRGRAAECKDPNLIFFVSRERQGERRGEEKGGEERGEEGGGGEGRGGGEGGGEGGESHRAMSEWYAKIQLFYLLSFLLLSLRRERRQGEKRNVLFITTNRGSVVAGADSSFGGSR